MRYKLENSSDQKNIWEKHTEGIEVDIELVNRPAAFQVELSQFISLLNKNKPKSIEVGCELGVTSYLLPSSFRKTFLDYNEDALKKCELLGKLIGSEGTYILGDMFNIDPQYSGQFDFAFNAGVVEHYLHSERVDMLKSMSKLINKDGLIIVAFPNHFSLPYRLSYFVRRLIRKWPFPKEYKLYDLQKEAFEAGLEQILRFDMSKKSLFGWLDPMPLIPIKLVLKQIDKLSSFEGYLTCVVLKKRLNE